MIIGKTICDTCNGNGFVRAKIEEGREEIILDCITCDNQGEITISENDLNLNNTPEKIQ